jgi:hypothetical protein
MSEQKTNQIFNSVEQYFENRLHKNPLTYLIARNGQKFYSKVTAPDADGNILLESYVKNYFGSLKSSISEYGLYDWDSDNPENGILTKSFGSTEESFYKEMRIYDEIDNDRFLKKQYPLRYFNLEIHLNDTQSIHLHQQISTGYQTSFSRVFVKLSFENMEKIKVIDFTNGFTVGHDFDFISFVDKENLHECFSIIQSRKSFEKLLGFIEKYKEAYEEVSKLDCIDLSVLGAGTEDCWRKCSSLLKYPNRSQCMSALNAELSTAEQTISKKFLDEKGIKYKIQNGLPILIPENAKQLKIVIKILSDKIVNTHFLHKYGLSDYIEEI